MRITDVDHPWGKQFTYKRYLHAPFSESIVTMWASSMILMGEIKDGSGSQHSEPGRRDESVLDSVGAIFAVNGALFPYKEVKYGRRSDGYPIHTLSHSKDGVSFKETAFCSPARVPATYVKVVFSNERAEPISFDLDVHLRKGREFELIGCGEPDGYGGMEQDLRRWEPLAAFKTEKNGVLTLDTYRFYYPSGFSFDGEKLTRRFSLLPGEKAALVFVLTRNTEKPCSFAAEQKRVKAYWAELLGRAVHRLEGKKLAPVFQNLLANTLQMFQYPMREDYCLVRQGGLQRYVWPIEAENVLFALAKIGGYDDFIDRALHTFFDVMQEKAGEDRGQIKTFGPAWGSITGGVLDMFGACTLHNKALFDKYREQALAAFSWIEKKRDETKKSKTDVGGLFVPFRSCDYANSVVRQNWSLTDNFILSGYLSATEAFKKHGDEKAAYLESITADYRKCMQDTFDRVVSAERKPRKLMFKQTTTAFYLKQDEDHIVLPLEAHNDEEIEAQLRLETCFPADRYFFFLQLGFAGYGTLTAERILRPATHYERRGFYMPVYASSTGRGYCWYTSTAEYMAYLYFDKCGDEKSKGKIIDSLLKYTVNNEYYMSERYDDHNGYAVPWMPNASANGRALLMLFNYYLHI